MLPPPTILLVEDDPLVLRALTRLLKSRGLEVVSASSVSSALRTDRACDGAIVDINLPDGSGLSLVEQLVARGDKPKVVFFSATVDQEEQRQATILGEFIRKERGPEAAVEYIERHVVRGNRTSPHSEANVEPTHSTVVPPLSTERRRRSAPKLPAVAGRRKA